MENTHRLHKILPRQIPRGSLVSVNECKEQLLTSYWRKLLDRGYEKDLYYKYIVIITYKQRELITYCHETLKREFE